MRLTNYRGGGIVLVSLATSLSNKTMHKDLSEQGSFHPGRDEQFQYFRRRHLVHMYHYTNHELKLLIT